MMISIRSIAIISVFFIKVIYAGTQNYWQQAVDYKMNVVLLDSVRQLACKSTITYKNNSPDVLDEIYMHLYPNAFQIGSVKYREYLGNAGRGYRAKYFKEKLDGFTSKVEVHNLSLIHI